MTSSDELLDEAYQRGKDYLMKYACAPGTFAAVMDTLGYEGDPEVEAVWKAAVGLVGGTGNMAIGTCGAMAGAAMAISQSIDMSRARPEDMEKMMAVGAAVADVGKKVMEKYGSITCQDIQFSLMGMSYKLSDPRGLEEFMKRSMASGESECTELNGDIARWTAEKILEVNPGFSKR